MTHGGAWLKVTDVLVSQANELLGASYQLYQHNRDVQDDYPHSRLCSPRGAAYAHSSCRTNDVLDLVKHAAADSTQALCWSCTGATAGSAGEARCGAVEP